MDRKLFLTQTQLDAITAIALVIVAVLLGVAIQRLLFWLLTRWAKRSNVPFATAIVRRTSRSAAYVFPLLAILVVAPLVDLPPAWTQPAVHVTGLLTIAAIAWALIVLVRVWGDVVVARHRVDVEDNLLARELGTRVDILARVVVTIVILVALGAELMTFPPIRALGTTLLASAGVAGIAVGLAARPLFENLVAGVQLALTQPIRMDDVVLVEKQYGHIEEIHSTYVVVRLWDLRRLVVPLTYFINTPFENWTRRTANLLGEVYVFADWTLDVEMLRAELPKIVARTPLWDQQFQSLQVTDVTERAVQILALVTARNSAELFDLRCFVREAIVAHIRDHQPHAMPKLRVELPESGDGQTTARPMLTQERIAKAVTTVDGEQMAVKDA
ncbi:MAG: mechanosensitive ion channel family protein [Candidatus Eremiobacteraeota bacterium]|nr:mechanosensitive ion channel family protein [Candidatus Eremiobacteraeota bacterium]